MNPLPCTKVVATQQMFKCCEVLSAVHANLTYCEPGNFIAAKTNSKQTRSMSNSVMHHALRAAMYTLNALLTLIVGTVPQCLYLRQRLFTNSHPKLYGESTPLLMSSPLSP